MGYAQNILKLYEMAKTRYIWFLADDETVLPGAVPNMISTLTTYQPVVAVYNHLYLDPYGRKRVDGVVLDTLHKDPNTLHDYKQILRTAFISVVVVEKRLPIDVIKKTDYTHNVFIVITLALLLLSNKFIFFEGAFPIVFRNGHNKYGEFFKFMMIDVLNSVFMINHKLDNKKFIREVKKDIFSALQVYLSQKLGYFKYHGRPTQETIKQIIRYYGLFSIFLLLFPILYGITPAFLLKFVYLIQLVRIHGYKKGKIVYYQNINKALKNTTSSEFVHYR
jgi:hypothetical protein